MMYRSCTERQNILLLLHQNALCWLWQPSCQTKSNIVEQNLQNFTISALFC